MIHSNEHEAGDELKATGNVAQESCSEGRKGPPSVAKDETLQKPAGASFEDFDLDDIEVLESKVFA
ncbi:3-thiaglutamate biosynthesis pearlin carrier peptide TglA [Sorangium sp. So ce1078]|uniref:3-thiaglutamate biosynthesis pearlin carrier peptide TglA n=1 Tax=Sorangium sp. So ce1078 TaxID=3133329 RepID=UPI003F5EB2B0